MFGHSISIPLLHSSLVLCIMENNALVHYFPVMHSSSDECNNNNNNNNNNFKDRKSQGGLLVIHTNSKGIMHKSSY